ncbi:MULTISPECIES: hypothetical protein [Cyanophyceae]|nr:hypothetical protein [Trichocoleus sp. FACHB-69]MBD1932605.1 hypothetical protein [Trichocoleus sp. FACHB-69]
MLASRKTTQGLSKEQQTTESLMSAVYRADGVFTVEKFPVVLTLGY